jgi:hypothetical protein
MGDEAILTSAWRGTPCTEVNALHTVMSLSQIIVQFHLFLNAINLFTITTFSQLVQFT